MLLLGLLAKHGSRNRRVLINSSTKNEITVTETRFAIVKCFYNDVKSVCISNGLAVDKIDVVFV